MLWWWMASARAGALCDELIEPTPEPARVQAALVSGDDPNDLCRWKVQVPMAQTAGGIIAAVLLPFVSWPIVFTETVSQKRKALPLQLGIASDRDPIVELLLEAGARPYDGALDEVVAEDRWVMAEDLVRHGASPLLHALDAPLAGDLGRLSRAADLGIRLDEVTEIRSPGAMVSDPGVAAAFLDAGLPADLLLLSVSRTLHLDVVDLVLDRADLGSARSHQALTEAAVGGRWTVVERLRQAGVPWERPGSEPVVVALVEAGSVRWLDRALDLGADPEARSLSGEPPLQLAIEAGRLDQVDRLLAAGAAVDATDNAGGTALGAAAALGRVDLVDALLKRGATVDAGSPPPLALALQAGKLSAAGRLLAAGAVAGDEVVRELVAADRADALGFLLRRGLPADLRLTTGETLAGLAVREDADDVLKALIAARAPLEDGLREAIARGRTATVTRLLDAGVDPGGVRDEVSWEQVDHALERILLERVGAEPPPERLLDAVQSADADRVRLLLAHGANPNAGATSPLERVEDRRIEALLLDAGARPPARLVSALIAAGEWEHLERLRLVGAELDPRWLDMPSAADLRWRGDLDPDAAIYVGWMVAHGADPDLGLTAAVTRGRSDLVGPLVAAGARVDRAGPDGRTPMQLAMRLEDDLVIDALLDAGHPYTAELVRYDVGRCRVDRLAAHVWAEPVEWTALRPLAREAGCRADVRAVARAR